MQKQFQYKGSNLFYSVAGSGQPVVLLHGFAEDSGIWQEQSAYLQQYCQLILPDLPGSGRSGILHKTGVEIGDYAACVNAVLQNENVETCIVLGHSLGGYITIAFAALYPEKLKGFGLVHSTAFADNEDKKTARKKGIAMIEEYGAYAFIKNTTPNLFADRFKKQHPERIFALIEQGKNFSKEALIQYYIAMMNRNDTTSTLQQSQVPVLFIMGSEDVAAPLNDLLQQVHLPKVSHIHLIEEVGHMSLWEAPVELNEHLLAFITHVQQS